MIILLGYRTPSSTEVPSVLYVGDDMDKALSVADETDLPRVGILVNPVVRPLRHWSEEAAATFAGNQTKSERPKRTKPSEK